VQYGPFSHIIPQFLSLIGSWGWEVGKAREGLGDVSSMHKVLTNQILLRDFS